MQASPMGKFCPPTTNFSFQLLEEVVQNCSSRRKEALISRGFEPRYLGCYEVLELARNFSFYFPPPDVASPHQPPLEGVTRCNVGGCCSMDSCLKMWFG